MRYFVRKQKAKFLVIEKSSRGIVKVFFNKKGADNLCHHLNNGSGFNGDIPRFFYSRENYKYK
jgi:hypothetical protein